MDKVVAVLLLGAVALVGRAACVPSPTVQDGEVTPLQYRENRFIFPFIIIRPEACTTTSTTYTSGVCYSTSDCTNLGGTGAGNCAKGLGVCCYFTKTCGGTATSNGTRFINPSSPGTDTTISNCVMSVDLISDNICQLRLDFVDFELAQPNVDNGQCVADFMTITGSANDDNIPTLCGSNTGKHMYVDVDPTGGSPKINFDTSMTTTNVQRSWDIEVTQIECNSAYRAPAGCLQYYLESSGVVESFNYALATQTQIEQQTANLHLSDQNYAVCVASRTGYCSITWLPNAANSPYNFMMTGDSPSASPTTVAGTIQGSLSGSTDCTTDYVVVPSGTFTDAGGASAQADRFCGSGFPAQVMSTMQPFLMYVVTDGIDDPNDANIPLQDVSNVGFSLQYRQNAC